MSSNPISRMAKGGLRDLQTLYWIGKYVHRVQNAAELVDVGLLTGSEYRSFRARRGFSCLAVRSHMHIMTGRAEDRLTFDLQRQVAERMQFADRPGKSRGRTLHAVLFPAGQNASASLTGVFLAHLDEEISHANRTRSGFFRRLDPAASRAFKGYMVEGGRLRAAGR